MMVSWFCLTHMFILLVAPVIVSVYKVDPPSAPPADGEEWPVVEETDFTSE